MGGRKGDPRGQRDGAGDGVGRAAPRRLEGAVCGSPGSVMDPGAGDLGGKDGAGAVAILGGGTVQLSRSVMSSSL